MERATRPDRLRAALLAVGGAGVAVGMVAFVGLVADGRPADGLALLGLVPIASIPLVTGVGAVCAVGDRSECGRRLSAAALGVFFLVGAIGDATGNPRSCSAADGPHRPRPRAGRARGHATRELQLA